MNAPPPAITAFQADHVLIVGPGKLGRSLAYALRARGVDVRMVGRGAAIPAAPLTMLTVPDRAIHEVALLAPSGGILLHSSGATEVEALRPHRPAGSLHPLMTFPDPDLAPPRFEGVPAAVSGDAEARSAARWLATLLGMRPFEMEGDRRLYHAAAVLAGNFATVLLAEAAAVLAAAGVPADEAPALLAPLCLASVQNAARLGPAAALTGPVARGDTDVIAAHRAALAALPDRLATYDALLAAALRLREQDLPPPCSQDHRQPDRTR